MNEDTVEEALEKVHEALEQATSIVNDVARRVEVLQSDVDVLFESQDMNVWVMVRGIQQGDIAPGEDPMDILRAMGYLQNQYQAIMALDAFIAEMSDQRLR